MRGNLSQTVRPTGAGPEDLGESRLLLRGSWVASCAGALASALLLSLAGGCQDADPEIANAGGVRKIEAATDTAAGDAFVWPDDPSHPVLELHVKTPEHEGTILIELMPELAPSTVVRVLDLADEGFYDGTTFHRVIPGFMIQGGDPRSRDRDPTNDGTGGMLSDLPDEFGDTPFVRGVVGLGNRGRQNSNSAQFFIMHADNRNLDGRYNAIGRVLEGMHLVDDITQGPIDRTGRWGPKDRPIENVVIESVTPVGQVAAIRAAMELERGELAMGEEAEDASARAAATGADTTDDDTSGRGRARASTTPRGETATVVPAATGPAAIAP